MADPSNAPVGAPTPAPKPPATPVPPGEENRSAALDAAVAKAPEETAGSGPILTVTAAAANSKKPDVVIVGDGDPVDPLVFGQAGVCFCICHDKPTVLVTGTDADGQEVTKRVDLSKIDPAFFHQDGVACKCARKEKPRAVDLAHRKKQIVRVARGERPFIVLAEGAKPKPKTSDIFLGKFSGGASGPAK